MAKRNRVRRSPGSSGRSPGSSGRSPGSSGHTPGSSGHTPESSSGSELERKYEKALKKIEQLEKKLASERHQARQRKKQESRTDVSLGEFLNSLDYKFQEVTGKLGQVLWEQLNPTLQYFLRDIIDKLACRWSQREHVPILDLTSVTVRDGKPIIPKPLINPPEPADYRLLFLNLMCMIFDKNTRKNNLILKDLMQKLDHRGLSIDNFQNLYFHRFLQTMEDIALFPAEVIGKLKDLKLVHYDGKHQPWVTAYKNWMKQRRYKKMGRITVNVTAIRGKKMRGKAVNLATNSRKKMRNGTVNLAASCRKSAYVNSVFQYKAKQLGKSYPNTFIGEANLVRNLIKHFDEIRQEVDPTALGTLQSKEVAVEIFTSFSHIGRDIYNFGYISNIDFDFRKVRTLYKKPAP